MDDGLTTSYNSLRLSTHHWFSNHFTLLAVYTWSHCMQNAETLDNRLSQGLNQYQNPNNRNADTGPCDFDLRHNFVTSFVYDRRSSAAADGTAGAMAARHRVFSGLLAAQSIRQVDVMPPSREVISQNAVSGQLPDNRRPTQSS